MCAYILGFKGPEECSELGFLLLLENWVSVGTTRRWKKPQECYSMFCQSWGDQSSATKGCESDFLFLFKSQDLSANRGCPLTDCAFYHLAGLHRDLTILVESKYKSEPTVDKYASPDNIILLSAHLTMWKVPFQRQMRERCVSSMPYSEAEPRRSPDSSNIAVIFVGSQLWKQNLENAATVQYGASGVSWEYLRGTVNSFFTKPLSYY